MSKKVESFLPHGEEEFSIPEDASLIAERFSEVVSVPTLKDPLARFLESSGNTDGLWAVALGVVNYPSRQYLEVDFFTKVSPIKGFYSRNVGREIKKLQGILDKAKLPKSLTIIHSLIDTPLEDLDDAIVSYKDGTLENSLDLPHDPELPLQSVVIANHHQPALTGEISV